MIRMSVPSRGPSMLIILLARDSPRELARARLLVSQSARPQERVIIIGGRGGVLTSSVAPDAPSAQLPSAPPPLQAGSTSFQEARHAQAIRAYRAQVAQTRAKLRTELRQRLAGWAGSVFTRLGAVHLPLSTRERGRLNAALSSAAGDVESLQQAGVDYRTHKVVAILGESGAAVQAPPGLPPSLRGATVVVDEFPLGSRMEAAWQADLVQDGAGRAVVLTPASGGQLGTVVREGLDGAITDTLSDVLFALGQHRLQEDAQPQLLRLLRLLTVTYPQAVAAIGGYTDDLPAPGGNLLLSRRRAQAVRQWLIVHGVAASRLRLPAMGTRTRRPRMAQGASR